MTDMDGWVAFVGAGPGDDGLLTMRAARLLGAASLVVAEAEVADRVRHLLAADARWPSRPTSRAPPRRWCRRPRPGSSPSGCSPATRCSPARPPRCRRAPRRRCGSRSSPACPPPPARPGLRGDRAARRQRGRAPDHPRQRGEPGRLRRRHPGGPRRGDRARRPRQDADRGRLARRDAVRDHLGRDHHRPADGRHHARPDRARPEGGRA